MGEIIEEQTIKKQRTAFVTYPIAVFVFFAVLVGVSIYMHNFYLGSEKLVIAPESSEGFSPEKEKKLQAVLAKKNDIVTQPIYQPVKKDGYQELVVDGAHAAIVFDAESGTILWGKNATEKRSVASITKLVTAMVAIDRIQDLDDVVVIPEDVISIEGTTVGCLTSVICTGERFHAGEKVRVRDLLKAMLIFSANDAATILGIHIAGSEEDFAKLMNARMKELGAGNTNFCRPSGLELDENEDACYSSAYDIARVLAHLRQYKKYDVLWEIMRTEETIFTNVEGTIEHELKNTNRLIGKIDNLVGAKTGFTPRAGYCLALASTDDSGKHTVISVVLDDYNRFIDVEMMSQWAFDNYVWQ